MLGASHQLYAYHNVARDDAYTDPGSLSIESDEGILPGLVHQHLLIFRIPYPRLTWGPAHVGK